jgi:hypothetical protein
MSEDSVMQPIARVPDQPPLRRRPGRHEAAVLRQARDAGWARPSRDDRWLARGRLDAVRGDADIGAENLGRGTLVRVTTARAVATCGSCLRMPSRSTAAVPT